MKTSLLAILLLALPLPVLSEDAADLAYEKAQAMRDAFYAKRKQLIREYYEAWLPTHQAELDQAIDTIVCDPKCHVGNKASNPERTDPLYRTWKELRRKQYVADTFERHWDPDKLRGVDSEEFRRWIKNNLEVSGNVSTLPNGPTPEEWIPDRVNPAGQAVDRNGEVSMEAVNRNSSTGLVYFWIPLVIGLALSIGFAKSGHPYFGFCLGYFGYGFLIGGTTGLKMVSLELMSAYVIVLFVFVVGFKLALSGLGVKKDE